MCIAPLTLTQERELWTPNGYEGGVTKVVPCGKCVVCLRRRAGGWMFRLTKEWEQSTSAYFVTLTYDDENIPTTTNDLQTLQKSDLQKFFKRLRHHTRRKIRYYACGEYGSKTHRPHYHAIIFDLPVNWCRAYDILVSAWTAGLIDLQRCSHGSIGYVTGYVIKGQKEDFTDYNTGEIDDRQPEFSVMSKKLGANYLTPAKINYHKRNLISTLPLGSGGILSMPRYYMDKIFDKEDKFKINEANREYRELNIERLFNNAIHEVQWKKDQQRKQEKQRKLQRQKL